MFNSNNGGYSLSDIAAITDGNRNGGLGWGDSGIWIVLFILILCGGWGGYGFGGNRSGGTTTREEIAYGFDMNGLENSLRAAQNGICDGFYAMNTGMLNGFAGVQNALCQGFSGINAGMNQNTNSVMQAINADTIANMQNTNAVTAGITALGTQMAQCCQKVMAA